MLINFDDSRYVCPVVFKNGFSTLAYVYYYKTHGKLLNRFQNVADQTLGDFAQNMIGDYSDYKLFVVWRDPYKRLISLYTDIASGEGRHTDFIRRGKSNRKHLLDDIGLFVHTAFALAGSDMHVMKLADVLKSNDISTENVDILVDIKDLQSFIVNELKFDKITVKRNISRTDIDVSGFEKFRDEIKSFYEEDYEIASKYREKFYVPKPYVPAPKKDPLSEPGKDVNGMILQLIRLLKRAKDKLYRIYGGL